MSTTPTQSQLEAEYKLFTDAIERHTPISPPAHKPASVPGGSGAALVGDPFTVLPYVLISCRGETGQVDYVCPMYSARRWIDLAIEGGIFISARLVGSLV